MLYRSTIYPRILILILITILILLSAVCPVSEVQPQNFSALTQVPFYKVNFPPLLVPLVCVERFLIVKAQNEALVLLRPAECQFHITFTHRRAFDPSGFKKRSLAPCQNINSHRGGWEKKKKSHHNPRCASVMLRLAT